LFDQKTLLDVSQKELKNGFPAFPSSPGNQRQGLPTIFVDNYAPSFRGTKVFICFSGHCPAPREPGFWQAVEKRTSAFVSLILRRATYQQVRLTAWGFRGPCVRTFLNSQDQRLFQQAVRFS
jgi:hypothetical protein